MDLGPTVAPYDYGDPIDGSPVSPGVHVYVGTTKTGKTHLAIQHAFPLAARLGVGVLVIDCRGASNFRDLPLHSPKEALALVREGGIGHTIPRDESEFELLMRELDRQGRAVVLVDECATFAESKGLKLLVRVWRHRELSFFFTTQKIGRDIEGSILACDPTLYLFRSTYTRTLEWAEKWHGIEPGAVKALERGQHFALQG